MTTLDQTNADKIRDLLVGHRVTKVDDDKLQLDNGTVLRFVGHEGGCSCGAGDYELTYLDQVDNIITGVYVHADPDGEDFNSNQSTGTYTIFVYADAAWINLAQFNGSDGNGYYGTGFYIHVTP